MSNVAAGAVLAAVSSLLYNAGFLVEKRALVRLPPVHAHRLNHLVRSLLSSRMWLVGCVVVLAGLLLQVVALSLAPLSVVQPVLVAGIIVLVVCSHVALGERLQRPERIAVALVILGLGAVVASMMRGGNGTGRAASQLGLLLVAVPVALVAAIAAVMIGRSRPGRARRRRSRRLIGPQIAGVAAGLLYGVAAMGLKSMSFKVRGHGLEHSIPRMLPTVGPWMLGIATLAGLVVFQATLQRHPASLVVPLSNVTSSAFAVIAGAAIFHETLPSGTWPGVVRYVGFALLLVGIVFAGAAPGEPEALAPASDVDVMGALPVSEPLAEAGQWPS